jgi:hypothetical protein
MLLSSLGCHSTLNMEAACCSETSTFSELHSVIYQRMKVRTNLRGNPKSYYQPTLHSQTATKSKTKLYYDRRSVGQSVLASGTHPGPTTTFLLTSNSFEFVDMRAPSLTRGVVCGLQLLLVLAGVVFLESESRGTHDSNLRLPKLECHVPVFISPRNKVAQLLPQALDTDNVQQVTVLLITPDRFRSYDNHQVRVSNELKTKRH